MGRYVARRLIQLIPVIWIISVIIFILLQLTPGDPASALEDNPNITAEDRARYEESLGLNDPLHIKISKMEQEYITRPIRDIDRYKTTRYSGDHGPPAKYLKVDAYCPSNHLTIGLTRGHHFRSQTIFHLRSRFNNGCILGAIYPNILVWTVIDHDFFSHP